jgi:putative transposase
MTDAAITELTPIVGVKDACAAVGRPRATHYRWHRKSPAPVRPPREPGPQPRALSAAERTEGPRGAPRGPLRGPGAG